MRLEAEKAKKMVREGFTRTAGLFRKKQTPLAMVIHDGSEWHVYLYSLNDGSWQRGKTGRFPGRNPHLLPEKLTAFAAEHGAQRVRILIPSEVYTIGIELPEDHEPEEAHTALAFELEGETELEVHAMRLAAVRADRFRMGGTSNNVLATPFENSLIQAFDDACRAEGLNFEGVGSMELAVLNYHARNFVEARCLLLRRQSSFYVIPATQGMPFAAQSIPATFSPDDAAEHQERYERVKRRFKTHADLPLVVWSAGPPDDERRVIISTVAGEQVETTVENIHDSIAEIALHAASAREVGTMFNGCALVGKSEKPKDPYRAGTWIFFGILVMCFLTLGVRYLDMRSDLAVARAREAAWRELEQKRKTLKSKADGMLDERNNCLAIVRQLSGGRNLPAGMLELLDMLRKEMPMYTRLIRLHQNKKGILVLEGTTFYQQAIDILSQSMCRAMQPLGLHVEPVGIEGKELNGELRFTFRIVSAKGML